MEFRILAPELGPTHPERKLCEEFRYKHYVTRLKYEPRNAVGLEKDEFDDLFTTYIAVVKNGCIVGFCRLISSLLTASVPLPLLYEFAPREIEGGVPYPTMEVSRLMVDPEIPRPLQCEAATLLYETVSDLLVKSRITTALAVIEPPLLYKLRRKYTPEAFVSAGEIKLSQKDECVLPHQPMRINVGIWADVLSDIRRKRALAPDLAAV